MNKIKNIFDRVVSGIILFIIYIFIVTIAHFLSGDGSYYTYDNGSVYIFCLCIAVIITLIWFFKHEYKKVFDYVLSAVSFCVMCFGMYAIKIDEIDLIETLPIYLMGLYAVANGLCFCVSRLIHVEKEHENMLLKRIVSTAILCVIFNLMMFCDIFTYIMILIPGIAVIITLIFYFITTKYLKISYDKDSLKTTIRIFLIINLIFCLIVDIIRGLPFAVISSFIYACIGFVAFVIIKICRFLKGKIQSDGGYHQEAENLSPGEDEEKDITGENELTNGSEPYINNNMQKAVLENMKSFLLDSGNDFLFIDEEYHLQAGKDVYYPDLLLYHMKLQCFIAVNLETDDFKPEYLDRMNAYLETLDRDFKKPTDNPSMGIFLCKNEETEVVEYFLNKGLSQEMKDEYEAKLIDKKILKEKLGELYDRVGETN